VLPLLAGDDSNDPDDELHNTSLPLRETCRWALQIPVAATVRRFRVGAVGGRGGEGEGEGEKKVRTYIIQDYGSMYGVRRTENACQVYIQSAKLPTIWAVLHCLELSG